MTFAIVAGVWFLLGGLAHRKDRLFFAILCYGMCIMLCLAGLVAFVKEVGT